MFCCRIETIWNVRRTVSKTVDKFMTSLRLTNVDVLCFSNCAFNFFSFRLNKRYYRGFFVEAVYTSFKLRSSPTNIERTRRTKKKTNVNTRKVNRKRKFYVLIFSPKKQSWNLFTIYLVVKLGLNYVHSFTLFWALFQKL